MQVTTEGPPLARCLRRNLLGVSGKGRKLQGAQEHEERVEGAHLAGGDGQRGHDATSARRVSYAARSTIGVSSAGTAHAVPAACVHLRFVASAVTTARSNSS